MRRDATAAAAIPISRIQLLDDEGFWNRLTVRIGELQDPRLTAATAQRMRKSLPLALLLINAQLAVRAAQAENSKEAQRHVDLMKGSGFSEEVVQKALRRVVEPMRQLIKTLCETADKDTDADPIHADAVTRRLLDDSAPLLAAFDSLLPAGDTTRDGVHDEVALRALTCQIVFGNKTDNWRTSLELLERVLPIAASESARTRVDDNLRIVRGNKEFGTCFFCGEKPAETNQDVSVPMHGNVQTSYVGYNQTRTTWNHNTFKVPRCGDCARGHQRAASARTVGRLLAFLSVIVFFVSGGWWDDYLFGQDAAGWYFFFGALIAFITPLYLWRAVERVLLKGRPGEEKKYEFTTILERKKQGWRFGLDPQASQAIPRHRPNRGRWLGDRERFRRWVGQKRPIFVSMFALWVPVPLVLALAPMLWGFVAGTPVGTRDLYRIGILSKSGAAKRLSDAAADASQNEPYRERALKELIAILPAADPSARNAVASLRKIVKDPDPVFSGLRASASELLLKIDPDTAVESLTEELASPDSTLRHHAAVKLREMGPAARQASEALKNAMSDSNSTVSEAATETLVKIAPESAVPKLISDLKSSGWQVRQKAAQVLAEIGPPAREALPMLERVKTDPNVDVRKMVASALHAIDPVGHTTVRVEPAPTASYRTLRRNEDSSPSTVTPQVRIVTPQVPNLSSLRASSLRLEIDSDKLQLSRLASSLNDCQRQLSYYQSLISGDRQMLDQMESNARLGLNVDRFQYEMTRNRHNSNVNLYNSQLQTCRSIGQEHDALVDRINSKVREYNSLISR